MARPRVAHVFSLSFLDIMSCGFGAVILIYITINHATEVTSQEVNAQLLAEIRKVEEQVQNEMENLATLRNTVRERDDDIITTQALAASLMEAIKTLTAKLANLTREDAGRTEIIEQLKSELKKLETETANLEDSLAADESTGTDLRKLLGDGDRQFLTGMRVGGEHILILLDASASMLDKTIVNAIRRRNLPDEQKILSEKWQRAIRTIEWIIANMPPESGFQVFSFNTQATPVVQGTESEWFSAFDTTDSDRVMDSVKALVPEGGTSLHHAFTLARNLEPRPDNIFLIVDSLPTMAMTIPRKNVIESNDRFDLFRDSLKLLPLGSPVNVILFPMEGDPIAAAAYWQLAQTTSGSFLSPPEDWP